MATVCPACTKPVGLAVRGQPGCYDYARCASCGLRFIVDSCAVIDHSVLQVEDEYIQSYSGTLAAVVTRRVNLVARFVPAGGRVLDYGAGYGFIADALRSRYAVDVTEKSQGALARLRDLGFTTYSSVDALPAHAFDAVTAWHVLEHVSDPFVVLESLREALRPGGSLIIAVPNAGGLFARLGFEQWVWTTPWHLSYFTPCSLRTIIERARFTCAEVTTDVGDPRALAFWLAGILGMAKPRLRISAAGVSSAPSPQARSRSRALNASLPLSLALQRLASQYFLGDELCIVARARN